MSNTEIKKSRNEQIAELLSDGEKIKDFYRFAAQNPHIDLHDACQIVLARPKASICFYMDEWNEMGRRVTKNRKGIQFYDTDGNKQYVFDLHDTHGDKRYRRLIFPMRRLLYGLDELNGTEIADSSRRDYSKVLSGVAQYLDENGYFTADEQRNTLLAEGVAYSLYSKTGFPKDGNIALRGMPYELDENARLFKEVYLLTELAKEDISAAYERRINTPQVIDDIEEETVSDEPTHAESSAGMPINAVETGEEEIEFPDGAQEGKEHVTDAEKQVFDETELSELADILAEEYSEQEEEIQPPKLEEITNDEPSPFSGEPQADEERETSQDKFDLESGQEEPDGQDIETEDAEEEWEDPDEEQRDETDRYLPETKDGKREKPGKGIRGRKRKDKPQLSLFDLLDGDKEPSREEQLIERQLLRGSGIEDGKYRIYDKYFTDPTIKEYAKFLKDEYGIGGYGYGQERQDHNGKGIRMEWQDREHPENSIRIDLKWNEVAVRVADLIDEDKYLTAEEKEDYEKRYKPKQAEEQRLREAEQKKKDEFVYRVIQNTNPTRKQHILGEYGKTTKIVEFAEFLRNEYGYSTEATSEYLARYNENGVWLSKYDKSGNTELHVNLSWNDFAEKVCDVIDDDCLFPEDYDEERNKRITDNIIREGTERTNDGNYAFFFGTYGESESYVREHCKEIEDVLRSRNEVKKVSSDDWYIHVTYYKDYCTNLQGTEEARQEHKERVRALAAQIVEEGTENTTEGGWVVYFNELTGDEEFAKTYAQEIAEELGRHESVADVEFDNTCIDTAFYLDYCPNYIPHEDEDGYAEDLETAETEQMPIKSFNRFTELAPEEKTIFDHYVQRTYQEPRFSPWGMVQDCTVIAPGIYSVVTAGHGGMMIDAALAPHILSPEALSEGFTESGYYCYEEDAAESIPLRELYDKGILGKTNEYFTCLEYVSTDPDAEDEYIRFAALTEAEQEEKLKQWNDAVNETVEHWYPSYWEAYQQAQGMSEDNAENTDLNAVLDQSDLGGAKTRFKNNVAAIRLSKFLHERNAMATDAERKVLAKYVGWGGLAQAFDETNEQWRKEYEELKSLLTPSEYETAKGSVLNAHYTSREVIGGIYAALERFGVKGNNRILEPALGTGNFFGYMPQEIATGARLYGVELDTVTGMIASKLYPQANVQIKGFEETSFPDDYFDLGVSNVPFGGYGVYDSEYSRQKFLIHDYFIAKSLDKVKPNGIVAVVTSKGTLDKLNPTARKYMAERAELLGAIRLPNTAFKQTANTEAVTDILFFQKRTERISDTSDIEWLGTGKTEDGFEVNNYFIVHPEMVLGTFAKETGLYGAEGITVYPDGRNLGEAFAAAVNSLPQNIYRNPEQSLEETVQGLDESVFDIRPMCYIAVNGKLYMRIGEKLEQQELPNFPKDAYERIAGMIALCDELRLVLDIQSEGCTDEVLNRAQRKLNADYDRFVRKYGYINGQTNTRLFREDGDAALLFACEVLSEDKTRATKADVFTKRTIRPYSVPAHTNDALEALQICRNERGGVDIAYIEELTGKDFDTVLSELGDTVYRDPVSVKEGDKYSGYQTAEEYLSGKVVEKLRVARHFAAEDTAYARNAAALEKVQPEPLKADEIAVRIGASWVKPEYYKQFLMELLDIYWYYEDGLTIRYNPFDNSWKVERADHVRKSAGMYATEKYGTSRANAFRLFEDCLNQRATSIYDTVEEDGREKRVLNQAETLAAREKQNKIKEAFADWIYADPKRREDLEETYNSLFNQIRLPSYDGSYLKFPGMNPAIELRPHQKNAVARIAGTGNSTLLHHVVGSGKSFTMAASAMKLRQYGLAKKPMIVVPNHLVQQMANEFRTLYPTAKLLIANKEDLEKNKRKQFVSKVAMGDWDSVIIAQSSFAKIPVSRARQERMMREEIAKIEAAINEMEEKTGTRVAVKNLERIKKGREAMLKKLTDSSKKDDVLIFENLGVDYLFVDEADAYKNRFLYTKMNNVSGISNAASARASDMQLKIEYINELHGGDKGVVFATGTPISNSMAEMYIMQSYLQKNTLEELGINYFDGWAADFGETVTALEMAPSGQGYRARTRFAKFTNLPELMTLYRSFADVQTADMVKLDVPEAERITVTLEPNEQTVQIAEEIAKRAEAIYGGSVDPHEDNMLKVTSDGKKLALDVRCFDPFLKDEGSGKLDECADNAAKVYEETNALRGTQLIFCDLSTPKKPYENYEYGKDFDVYNDLKHKLIERGIPAEEIAFIHDAKTDKEKQTLFDKMNEGRIRILIGSTEKCGAGTNVQKRLAALHHLDAPYRPRDLQQRDGRGIRQHNMNKSVKIFTYVTKRTLDSYCYQILENKQRFISQIENGSLTVREAEDIDETTLSYAEIKAITAANPKIKRKVELETELTRLRVLEGQYRKNLYALQDKTIKDLPTQIHTQEQLLKYAQEDEANMREKYNPDVFSINVLGKVYTDKKEGAAALVEALRSNKYDTPVAEYGGFRISLNSPSALGDTRSVALTHHGSYGMEIGDSEMGLITRLDNFMRDFSERKGRYSAKLEQLKRDLAVAETELKKPFEHKGKIEEIMKELSEINAELDLNKREEVVIDTEEESDDEEVNYMALPEKEPERTKPASRPHKRMTEKLYALYTEQKAKMPDAVIFLKNGDFYETVGGEAKIAADTYGAATYEKELGGEKRIVAMLTYENLDAMVKDLSEENRQFKILEPEKEIGRDTDFLEIEEEAKAIAENEKEPEVAAEEEDKVYYSVVPEDEKYILYMIDNACKIYPVGDLYATLDEAREAAQTFGDEPQNCERVEVSLDELQEYASNAGDEAKLQVPILPDYYITQEEMHEYGYLWNGVLPLTKPVMQNNFQNWLLLYKDDTEGYIAGESDIEEHDGLFGIERSDWKRFIESENGKAYLAARLFASTAVMKMVGEEYSETDEREADGHEKFTSRLKAENVALSNYFKDKWFPLPEAMQPYAENIVAEYAERIEGVYKTEARGKTSAEIKSEIIARIGMPEILSEQNRAAAKEVVFNENREYLEQHGEVPCYVIEHIEKTGKYRYRTIGGYEIFVPSQEYDDEQSCRAAAPRGVELADMEELAEISRMRCKIYPDYFVNVSENGQYYPLSKRKAQQLFNLGLPVCYSGGEAEYVPITEQSTLDNTEKDFFIGRAEWYAFTRTDAGKAYLYARLLTVKATKEVVEKDLDTVGYYADSYAEVFYEERKDLENIFNGQLVPSDEAVKPYLYGLCREHASMMDGNGKLRYYGWWYEDIAKAIARNLSEQFSKEVEQTTVTETEALKPKKTYYSVMEKDREWRLCGIDNYDAKVTYIKFQTEEKRGKYIRDMLSSNSGLQFEEITYEKLNEIADEMKAKREEFISQDREVFLEKRTGENPTKAISPETAEDVPVKESSVRPDYWISDEEMHEYGYTREDMLPLRERAAKYLAEQFSPPVYKLYQNNAAEQTKKAGEIDTFGGIFGINRKDWKRFLTSEKARGYFGAMLAAVTAAQKALNNDMGNVDARFTDAVSDELFAQNNEISRYLSQGELPSAEAMKPYIRQAVREYAYWLNVKIPLDYGWDAESIEAAMLNYVEPAELKSYLNQSGGGVRYYGKDTENTAYAYVKGELNEHTFKEILEQSNGADTLVIAAESSAFDAEALRLRSVVYLELGKEIQRADLSNEDAVIGKMQEIVDKLTAERAKQSMDLYQRIRDSVLAEYNEFEKDSEEELPYKQRFYTAVKEYFAKGGANLLDENDMKALEQDKGNILARLYDYDRDGVAHDLSDDTEITVLIEYYNENKVSENAGTEDKDCAKIVRERVTRLYEQYKREHPDYANNRSSNLFYRNMHEYLQYTDTLPYAYFIVLEKDGDEVLARICEFYEQNGDLGLHTYGERQEIIEQYTKKYYPEVLHEAEKPKYFGKGADGAAYYFLPQGLDNNALAEIKIKASEYIIAAPKSMLPRDKAEEYLITFLKTERDIPDSILYGTAATAKHAMREAAEQARRDKEYRDTTADNARLAWGNLRSDSSKAEYKERFFGAFAEFMAESDTFLEAGDYAELIKDGDAITERVYAHYMGTNDKIDFEDWEELSRLTKDYIDERWKMQKAMTEGVPLYGRTLEYAKANDEKNLYRQSLQANIECKHEIEQAIRNNFDGMHLNKGFENKLIEQFGMARVKYVLANTVQENDWDGRYSPETKEWAKTVTVTEKSDHRSQFVIGTHPAVLDGFINRVRKAEKAAEKMTEEKQQEPKEEIYYAFLYEKDTDDRSGYRAYVLDEGSGRLLSVFREPVDQYETILSEMEKFERNSANRQYRYIRVEPHELLAMSSKVSQKEGKGEEVQEERYRTETKKGLPVVHIEKDKYGHDIAIVKRKDDFVVAIGYDVNDGTWAQGRYDFPTQDAAQKYIDKNYKPQEEEKGKWLAAKVSKDALIRRYEKHSFFRMPNGEYEEYTYNVFNNRVKDGRQLVDLQSDGHELCYELVFPADGEITIKTRDGDEVIFPAEEFIEIIGGTTNADYERKDREDDTDWYAISVPQEAHRGTYERSSLFSMPSKSEYAGYSYYIPNVFVEEDKRGEDGNILITLPDDFHVTLRNRTTDDEIVVTPFDLYTECNGKQGEDYARKQSETEDVVEKKKQVFVTIPAAAKIAEYKTQTLFKMPHTGEYDGYCFYLFNDQLSQGDGGIRAKLSENFTVQLKDKKNDRQATLTAEQFKAIMDEVSAEDFDSGLKKPSEEKEDLFEGAEEQLRKNIPEEMLARPNWVAVKVFRDKKKDKLVKLPKDTKTGEAASPNDPSTWSDFDTACRFAHENGCASLAYALDGKDNICCIDIDHCFNAKRVMSDIAKMTWNACGNTYREVSVSREGLHIFGKTKGMGLQVFSDAGDMEFYERGKFMTVTGDAFGEGRKNLLNLDELPVRDLLSRKFSKHKTYSWAGKGIKGLSSMTDREVLEKAFASKDGEAFKALFNGEDLKNNHSNSDMALMVRLAFWCNGDKDQMLRIFAASGLYRPDKSPEYFEYTALKAVQNNPNRYEAKQIVPNSKPAPVREAEKGGK